MRLHLHQAFLCVNLHLFFVQNDFNVSTKYTCTTSGPVVVCLTRDRGAAGSSLTGVTVYSSSVLVQPWKTRPCLTERLFVVRKESNKIKKILSVIAVDFLRINTIDRTYFLILCLLASAADNLCKQLDPDQAQGFVGPKTVLWYS